jgi:hypothetical protein
MSARSRRVGQRREQQWESAAARRITEAVEDASGVEDAVAKVVSRLLSGVSCPPTDLGVVCRRLDVITEIVVDPEIPSAGELRRIGTQFQIAVAQGMPPTRQRFTIAHELGHAFFESTGPGCPRSGDELERICDLFAAELLMPQAAVRARFESVTGAEAIVGLVRDFGVSPAAAVRRANEVTKTHSIAVSADHRILASSGLPHEFSRGLAKVVDDVFSSDDAIPVVHGPMRLISNRVWNGQWEAEGIRIDRSRALVVLRPLVD